MHKPPAEHYQSPITPELALHQALQAAFETKSEWSVSTLNFSDGIEVTVAEKHASSTENVLDSLTETMAGNLREEKRRETTQPPGRLYLLGGFMEDFQHLQGSSEITLPESEPQPVLLHLQRMDPDIMPSRIGDEMPTVVNRPLDRYLQASEMITIFHQDGQVTNLLMLPSEDLSIPCEEVLGFTFDLAADAGWDEQFQLTASPEQQQALRSRVKNSLHHHLIDNFPDNWTKLKPEDLRTVTESVNDLRPIEY